MMMRFAAVSNAVARSQWLICVRFAPDDRMGTDLHQRSGGAARQSALAIGDGRDCGLAAQTLSFGSGQFMRSRLVRLLVPRVGRTGANSITVQSCPFLSPPLVRSLSYLLRPRTAPVPAAAVASTSSTSQPAAPTSRLPSRPAEAGSPSAGPPPPLCVLRGAMFLIQSIDPHVPRPGIEGMLTRLQRDRRGDGVQAAQRAATASGRHSTRRRPGPRPLRSAGGPAARARSGGGGPAWQAVKPFPFYQAVPASDASSTVHRSRYSLQEWSANTSYSEINCEREGLGYLSLGSEPKAMRRSSVKSTSSSPLASMILDACIRNMHRCKHVKPATLTVGGAMDKSEKCPVDASVHYKRSAALPRGAAGLGDER
ncbi:hypothetical protein U9M48_000332 [Paspalum notatum var. saurae]|uniref:Uncharacterized protein n=1 Tax=Paspalum notatum var. saurae TaxID=547442 RepID=A0AAQ3SEI1_PASNO